MNFKYFWLHFENTAELRCSENDICTLRTFVLTTAYFAFPLNFALSVTGDCIPDHRGCVCF